jgi:hypothetical protein
MDRMDAELGTSTRPIFAFQERRLKQIPPAPFQEDEDTEPELPENLLPNKKKK